MTAPLGEARVRVGADADDFPDELADAIDGALDTVVRNAAEALSQIETDAASAGNAVGSEVRAGAEAASRAINNIDPSNLDDVRAAAARMGQELQEARAKEARAASEAMNAERALRDALGSNETTTEQLAQATGRLQQAQERARTASREAAQAAERQEAAQEQLNNATRDGTESSSRLGESVGGMVGKLAGAAVGLAGVATAADTMFESFDRQDLGNKLRAQLDLTKEESEQAGQIAGRLYAQNYGESFEAVNEATGAVLSSLGNLADDGAPAIEALTAKALTLAQTFGLDVNEAAQAANQMIRDGIARDGTEAFDLLGAAMQRVPAQMRDELIPVIGEYGGYLTGLGFSGQEALGLIVNASQQGAIEMDKVGDAIKEFGIRATDMSKASGAAYEALGLDQKEMSDALLAGGETAQGAFDRIVAGLQGMTNPSDQAAAAIALFGTPLEDLDVTKIPGFLRGLSNADSAMGDFAGTADDMAAALAEGPSAQLEQFKRRVQDAMLNGLGQAAGYLNNHRGLLVALSGVIGTVVIAYGAIRAAAVVSAVAQGIHAAATGADTAALAANRVAAGSAAIAQGVMRAGALAGAIATGIATAATWAFNAALAVLTSPITLIIAGIALLVGGLIWFFTQTELGQRIVTAVWDGIKAAFSAAWDFIGDVFTWMGEAWDWVAEKATSFWTNTVQPVLSWIGGAFQTLWAGIELVFRLWGAAFEVVGTALRMLWDNVIFPVLEWIGGRFVWLWETVISPVIGWVVARFEDWKAGMSLLWDIISAVAGWIGDRFMWLWNAVISPVIGWIVGKFQDAGRGFQMFWDVVQSVVGWIWGKIQELGGFFGGIVGFIIEKLGNAGSALFEWGRNLIQGLLDGAGSLLSKIGQFFLDKLPGWVKDPFKKAMGIASPSKVFAAYGVNLGEGLIQGADATAAGVQAATQRLADAAGNVTMPQIDAPALGAPAAPVGVAATAPVPLGPDPVAAVVDPVASVDAALPAIDALGAGLTAAKDGVIDPAVTGMQANLNAYATSFPDQTAGTILPAMGAMGAGILAQKDNVIDPAMWGMQANMAATGTMVANTVNGVVLPQFGAMGSGIMGVKTGSIDPAFAGIQGGLATVQGAFATGVSAISTQWDQMRGAVGRPVRFAIDTVFNNGLVGMWNSVSDLIGSKKMAPYVVGGFAKGTDVLPGYSPGVDNMRFVSQDGSTAINLSGGEGIARPEVVRAIGTTAWNEMNAAAVKGGPGGVARYLGGFASGGVVAAMTSIVKQKYPMLQMTSGLRPGDGGMHGRGLAGDFSNGSGNTPAQLALARDIAATYPGSSELIYDSPGWANNIKNGRNVGPFGAFYTMAQAGNHRHHVHWAMTVPPTIPLGGGMFAGGSDGGGAGLPEFDPAAYVQGAFGPKRKEIESALAGFSAQGLVGSLPDRIYRSMSDAMETKAVALAKASMTFADPGGAGVERWRPLVETLLTRYGLGLENTNRTLRRMNQESGGNPRAINNWDSNAAAGTPSKGLMQVIDPTFAAFRDPALSSDIWDPMANVGASMRYAMKRYGSLASAYDRAGGYDLGGLAAGRGLMLKDVISPERVLSPEQTAAFERIIPLLEGLRASGSGSLTIGGLTLRGEGDLSIRNGRLEGRVDASAERNGERTVLVHQYITGDNARDVADETGRRLLALLP